MCGEEVETIMHCWTCKALGKDRIALDEELSKIDHAHLPNAVKIGFAPAMTIDPAKPYWGDNDEHDPKVEGMPESTRKQIGCRQLVKLKYEIREFFREEKSNDVTARELIQYLTMTEGCKDLPLPEKVKEGLSMPKEPNVYSDGSVKNPRGLHWKVGGVGVWWKNRNLDDEPVTETEEKFMHYQMCGNDLNLWTCFNDTQNSSTRCELGAAILGINPPIPAHVGIDNQGLVSIGTQIIEHMEARQEARFKHEEGALRLGGTISPLQRTSPFKRLWSQFQDGDLWERFQRAVEAKGPRWVRLRKVKGHATDEMVSAGNVQEHERLGNNKADANADK
jgi:hypothetical protein